MGFIISPTNTTKFKGWGYQDFTAGEINSTNVTITANNNGTGYTFNPISIISGTAVIVLKNNGDEKAYSGSIKLFSTIVEVVSHNGVNITLNAIPHISWGDIRIYYYYNYLKIPRDYIIAPKTVSATLFNEIDSLFITEEEYNSRMSGLLINRLVATDAAKQLIATDIYDWIEAGANVTVTDLGDGRVRISSSGGTELPTNATFDNVTINTLTANRIIATDETKKLINANLTNFISGTSQIVVTDDLDGTVTINLASGVVAAGTYSQVTVDTYGRVVSGTNPTTLNLDTLTANSIASDFINEKTLNAGVVVDGVLIKDGNVFIGDYEVVNLNKTQTLLNKTLTAPKIDTIYDSNNKIILQLTSIPDAIDYLNITNSITPMISAMGDNNDINIVLQPKGTGIIQITTKVSVDEVLEYTSDNGVNIEGIIFKDGNFYVQDLHFCYGANNTPIWQTDIYGNATRHLKFSNASEGSPVRITAVSTDYGNASLNLCSSGEGVVQVNGYEITNEAISKRDRGSFWDIMYWYKTNIKTIDDCDSGWVNNGWTGNPGTVSFDSVNKKTGSYAAKCVTSSYDGGIHKIKSLDLTTFNDGNASQSTDYIQFCVYISDVNLLPEGGLVIKFFNDSEGVDTNAAWYPSDKTNFVSGWNFVSIQKGSFDSVGSFSWASITGFEISSWGQAGTNLTFTVDAMMLTRKDELYSFPNPFQRKNNNSYLPDFLINSGAYYYFGYENGKLILRNLNPLDTGTGWMDGSLYNSYSYSTAFRKDYVAHMGQIIKTANSSAKLICGSSNKVVAYISSGTLYLVAVDSGIDDTTTSIAMSVNIGDYIEFKLVRYGSDMITLFAYKNGDYSNPTVLTKAVTFSYESDNFLQIGSSVGVYANIVYATITNTFIASNAVEAIIANKIKLKYNAGVFTSDTLDMNELGVDTTNNRLYLKVNATTIKYITLN
jgi:hypothetical protein